MQHCQVHGSQSNARPAAVLDHGMWGLVQHQNNQEWELNGATELAWLQVKGKRGSKWGISASLEEERGSCVLY